MNPQVESFVGLIRDKLPSHESPAAAAGSVKAGFEAFMPFTAEMIANLASAVAIVESTLQGVEILRRNSLVKEKNNWYAGPTPTDPHWSALEGYLRNAKRWDNDSVQSIDETSSEIVSLLADPKQDQFTCRGLVVGYVQSGKTANMTAVIAKAVDAGYNMIVLLGGVTNKLRGQTQRRIEGDIVNRHRTLWQLYTTHDDNGDFTKPANGQFTMPVPGRAQLAVIKKESTRLATFLQTIEKTPTAILRSLKALIIDDECDQASVNSSKNELDMTRINEAIRKIIRALPAVSYVGYTATPFANVFIDPFPHNKDELDDLYPEDFITDLPKPKGYFGSMEVFGFDPDDASHDVGTSAGRNMLRRIPSEEVLKIRPSSAKDRSSFTPQVTTELERALFWFILSSAVRRMRGHVASHMTMLIHTSQNISQHDGMANAVKEWLVTHRDSIQTMNGEVWERLSAVWANETTLVPLDNEDEWTLAASDLLQWIVEVLDLCEVAVENGESLERLNFTEEAKTYIVIGGTVLARGLTLEGLSVSFFLRSSQQYDTLLQMGRWFGFRQGYSDLPRLWTTQDLISDFRALAHIEDEIREDIAVYREKDVTPLQFAVKVRAIPGLAITSAGKMRHAYRTSISFEGRHVQTIRFDHRNSTIVGSNWDAATKLVDEIRDKRTSDSKRILFQDVPLTAVRRFLMQYKICEKHLDLKQELLLGYLDKAAPDLKSWNVAVITTTGLAQSEASLGHLGKVGANRRSRLSEQTDYADIKALMSKQDILVDAQAEKSGKGNWDALKKLRPGVPLLLIYPIEASSEPRTPSVLRSGTPTREALNAIGDIVGMGIVFPGTKDRSGGYYGVELDIPTPEDLQEVEDGYFGDLHE